MIFYKEMMYGLGEAKIRIVESSLLFFPNKERSALIEHSACDSIYPCGYLPMWNKFSDFFRRAKKSCLAIYTRWG